MTTAWTDFFTTLTAVSATILGLLFVGLQINEAKWELAPLRLAAAYRHLIEIATPVGVGLVALYPGGWWWIGGYIGGGIGLASVLAYWVFYFIHRHKPKTWYDRPWEVFVVSLLLVVVYIAMIIGSHLHNRNSGGLNLVGALCIGLVMAGVTQSWLVVVVKAPTEGEPEVPKVTGPPDGRVVAEAPPGGKTVAVAVPPGGQAEPRFLPEGGVAVTGVTWHISRRPT